MTATRPSALCALGDAATILLASALGMVVEIVAGRLLAPHVGMSLYTWTAIIAVVLGGFSLGHWWGGRLAGAECDRQMGHRRLGWLLCGCAAATLLAVPALRLAAPWLEGEGVHPLAAILGLSLAAFFLPSLLVGTVSPIVTKLAVEEASPGQVGPVLGRLFAVSALGAIAGTLAAGFLFVAWLGSTATMLACAGLYGLLAAGHAGAALAWARRRAALPAAAAAGLAALLLPAGLARLPAFASPCEAESAYFCIRGVDLAEAVGQPARLMVLDHLAHGANVRDEPTLFVQPYLHLVDEVMAARGLPERPAAFFLGGGAFTLPRAWAADHPGGRFTVAELDPAVAAAARRDFWLEDSPALTVLAADGRPALQALPAAAQFDLVFADAFHDIAMPVHLATREWHRAVRARLRPGGAYAANVMEDKRQPRFLLALARTLALDFPVVEVWVEMAEAPGRRVTYLLLASDAPTPFGRIAARRGPERRWARLPPEFVAARIATAGVPVLTDDFAPVDRLMSHLILSAEGSGR
ncbi:fused MFS/spermidine synthase [Roseicella aerolata]|uniref:Fused MFS/spermidine synthase n=1 Tax=Roseicella aerolata TaxID=2883479 RepID=A0A9X1IIJ8_9PROT|nr:fused MFS/spermidine synthase [Roseicella aerolata]MCB4823730.1 fused MFS/spermidine synthase [Roseicella aerolata]